ncbi:MAG: hypothetical protein A2133_00975 [Actinobacteria bacterium RBG_16_64_13]|nr:MAG: hypothetical protein A2133_00975 [Actinobacteria bacterium RBG_16_64_13]
MSCVDGMRLSTAQRAAALDSRSPVLVAAGAGSGKTRLLVAYFVRALIDEGIPAEQLVAVTFTRKAAAELVGRIRSTLEACGRSDLARSLDAAMVGTIHGLCRRLIRDRALEAGVDPACNVLEAEEASLIKEEVSRLVWERVIEQADETELGVLASRGRSLRKAILPLYDRMRGLGLERPQMEIPPGSDEGRAREEALESVRDALASGHARDCPGAALASDLGRLEECLRWFERTATVYERADELALTEGFFPSRKTRSMEPCFEPVRQALTRYRQALAEVRLRPVVSTMNRLLAQFHDEYSFQKRERGLLDFADLELRALALVEGAVVDAPSRPSLPGAWVLVDEFQDTNELQCGILERLGAARLLMVGDERQSIYRFRGADVSVFTNRETRLSAGGDGASDSGLHRLDVNYRSCPQILAFINRLFSHRTFFGSRFAPLTPPDPGEVADSGLEPPEAAADLVASQPGAGRHRGVSEPAAVEVLAVERRFGADLEVPAQIMQQAEAEAVAARVRELIDLEGRSQREIVVLLPAQTYVNLYRQALLANGVEVYVVRGKGYYSQEEVTDVVALLRLLVNPHDDLALVSALRSPLVGISDDGLYLLGQESRRERASLWEMVRQARAGSLDEEDRRLLYIFAERLRDLRPRVGRPGLSRLIDTAITACGYDLCLLSSAEGKRRFANVRKLMRLAAEFEALEGPDLAGFVDVLQSMGDLGDREGSAPTLAEGEDVVRVMSVHQAKGLEFPVVVLAGLGSNVLHEAAPEFVVGDGGRMGVFLKGSQRKSYEEHDLCWGPAAEVVDEERVKEDEEDIRLLYVAMTRAQERLILVGAKPRGERLDDCRLGRIAAALGLTALPRTGESVSLEGLEAPVTGVAPASAGTAETRRGAPAAEPGIEGGGACPAFLDVVLEGAGPRQVSFSSLAAYQRCPRQFYLERILGPDLATTGPVGDDPDDDDGSPAPAEIALDEDERWGGRDVGLLVHALLEKAPPGGRPAEPLLRSAAVTWLAQAGVSLSVAQLDRALSLALAFWDSPVAGRLSSPSAMREAPFFFAQGEIMVSGIMDLICREEGEWRIVDYKTNALCGRTPAELASGYELQAVVYCLAALRSAAPAVRMDFVFLEEPDNPVTFSYSREDTPRLGEVLESALDGLKDGRYPMRSGDVCGPCPVVGVCAIMAAL